MRRILGVICVFALVLAVERDAAAAGRGGGGGGFGGPSGGFGAGNPGFGASSYGNLSPPQRGFPSQTQSRHRYEFGSDSPESRRRSGEAFEQRRLNEQRILEHRLDQAEHLSERAAENGNARLGETATRMEQNAQQHHTDHVQQIDRLQNRAGPQIGPSHMSQNPAIGQPRMALPNPPVAPKKRSFFDRMKGLWPFK